MNITNEILQKYLNEFDNSHGDYYTLKHTPREERSRTNKVLYDGIDWEVVHSYNHVHTILAILSEYNDEYLSEERIGDTIHEAADGLVDIYNIDLISWLSNNPHAVECCDDATNEYGAVIGIINMIRQGQYHYYYRAANHILDVITRAEGNE